METVLSLLIMCGAGYPKFTAILVSVYLLKYIQVLERVVQRYVEGVHFTEHRVLEGVLDGWFEQWMFTSQP